MTGHKLSTNARINNSSSWHGRTVKAARPVAANIPLASQGYVVRIVQCAFALISWSGRLIC